MVRRLMLVVHQGHAADAQGRRGRDLRVRIMTDGEIDATPTSPLAQSRRASQKVSSFAGNRSAAVPANDMRHHSGFGGQLNCLRKVTRSDFQRMSALNESRDQRMEKRNVGRIGEI